MANGVPVASLPIHSLSKSSDVLVPMPRVGLEAEYPDSPDIVNALRRIHLQADAPCRSMASFGAKAATEGCDAETIAIYLQIPRAQRLCSNAAEELDKVSVKSTREKLTAVSLPTSISTHAGLNRESTSAPRAPYISIPDPTVQTDLSADLGAPDVLLMTPLKGPDGGAGPFDDGSVTFTLAAASASPDRPLSNFVAGAYKGSEKETKPLTTEAARHDGSFPASSVVFAQGLDSGSTVNVPSCLADSQDPDTVSSCSSSFIFVSPSTASS